MLSPEKFVFPGVLRRLGELIGVKSSYMVLLIYQNWIKFKDVKNKFYGFTTKSLTINKAEFDNVNILGRQHFS